MINITHTSWKKRIVKTLVAPMSLGLLLTGCSHQTVLKPLPGVSPQKFQEEAVAYCKGKSTLSWKEKLDFIHQFRDTFSDAGSEAGSMSDLVTQSDDNSGSQIGESVGGLIGTIGAVSALYQNDQAEELFFKACMQENGYMVMES